MPRTRCFWTSAACDGLDAPLRPESSRRPLHDHTPCGHWETQSVIAALRVDHVSAPAVFDGRIDEMSFRAYVERVLVPTLRPGDVVVLDNRALHKRRTSPLPSKRSARRSDSGRPTVPTSIPSNRRLQNGTRPAPRDRAPSIMCGPLSPLLSTFSRQRSARNYIRPCGDRLACAVVKTARAQHFPVDGARRSA